MRDFLAGSKPDFDWYSRFCNFFLDFISLICLKKGHRFLQSGLNWCEIGIGFEGLGVTFLLKIK